MFIYEVLFRGTSDGAISGQHVKYGESTELGEIIGPAQPVTGQDVKAIIGELCTMQAQTIASKDAKISELKNQIAALKEQLP